MRTLDIMFGLHFYQPPTQRAHVLKRITEECYVPLCALFEETELRNCIVVDMAAALMEQLSGQCPGILSRFCALYERGKISFANTAAFDVKNAGGTFAMLSHPARKHSGWQLVNRPGAYRRGDSLPAMVSSANRVA